MQEGIKLIKSAIYNKLFSSELTVGFIKVFLKKMYHGFHDITNPKPTPLYIIFVQHLCI